MPLTWQLRPGTDFVIKRVLPLGIVLLGAGLDFYNLLMLGMRVLAGAAFIIAAIVLATRYLSRFVSVKCKLAMLIGIGTAICGSAAIVAAAPVIESDEEDIAISIAAVNLLGGGDRTFHLGLLLASAGKWLTTGAMAAVGLITEFRALKTGGVRPFALGLASTGIIAVLGLAYASL